VCYEEQHFKSMDLRMTRFISSLCAIAFLLGGLQGQAQLRLPAIISSGMVLQQNDSIAVWGWANPGEKVTITPGWASRTDTTVTGHGARWKVKIKTPAAGGPFSMRIATKGVTIQLQNIMIGEVWVCSGQSNMEWSYNNGEKDTRAEIAGCATNNIHFFQLPKSTADAPQDDVKAQWVSCDSNTLKSFSAIGYFFGRELQRQLNVPIGLINTSWGGTPAEVWTPESSIDGDTALKAAAARLEPAAWWPHEPGSTYNAMIAPLTNFSIAGAIWYQGESNTKTAASYQHLFTAMIDSWRTAWRKPFPFYYVQIAPYKYGNKNIGALLQEAQTRTLTHSNTGMVLTTDLTDSVTNIHPSHKREVGNRLARLALAQTYKLQETAYRYPAFESAQPKGNTLVLNFTNVNGGLQSKSKPVTGFFISGAVENWLPADVKVEKDKIILSNKEIKQPLYIRYGFGNTETATIFSTEGLPLIPFRTDSWPVDQSAVK
jgi:sialate O-acetylesterase